MTARNDHIAVSTLCWEDVSVECLVSWMQFWASYQESDWNAHLRMYIIGGCLLPFARNRACLKSLKENDELTHVLMIDSDVHGLRAADLRRMVEHDVPIVSALVTKPVHPYNPACEDDDGYAAIHDELAKDSPGLVQRKWTGTGCILIKKEVLLATQIVCEKREGDPGILWFRTGRSERIGWDRDMEQHIRNKVQETVDLLASCVERANNGENGDESWLKPLLEKLPDQHMESFLRGRACWDGGIIRGEDVDFGLRAGAKGFRSYVDCGIKLHHTGARGYDADDHLEALGIVIGKRNSDLKREKAVDRA